MRTFGKQTLTGNAQPLFGDVLTAAFSGTASNGVYTVTVASNTYYQNGDRIILNPGVLTGANSQGVLMVQGKSGSTKLLCASEGNATINPQPNGAIIAISIKCFDVSVQSTDGNAAVMYLGADGTVTAAGAGSAFFELGKVAAAAQPNVWRLQNPIGADGIDTSEFWIAGAANDTYFAGAEVN